MPEGRLQGADRRARSTQAISGHPQVAPSPPKWFPSYAHQVRATLRLINERRRTEGLVGALRLSGRFLGGGKFWYYPLYYWAYRLLRISPRFEVDGRRLRYFYHRYNMTWANERAIEIPIALSYLHRFRGRRVLEVGNVLANYFPVTHEVLDKYEQVSGVIHADVAAYRPADGYDLILSISTLEHVGYDESPRDPRKLFVALDNLQRLLRPGGLLAFTVPLGYNPLVDEMAFDSPARLTRRIFLRRVSRDNRWRQVTQAEVANAKYEGHFSYANELMLAEVRKDPARPNTAHINREGPAGDD